MATTRPLPQPSANKAQRGSGVPWGERNAKRARGNEAICQLVEAALVAEEKKAAADRRDQRGNTLFGPDATLSYGHWSYFPHLRA